MFCFVFLSEFCSPKCTIKCYTQIIIINVMRIWGCGIEILWEFECAALKFCESLSVRHWNSVRVWVCVIEIPWEFECASLKFRESLSVRHWNSVRVWVCVIEIPWEFECASLKFRESLSLRHWNSVRVWVYSIVRALWTCKFIDDLSQWLTFSSRKSLWKLSLQTVVFRISKKLK